MLSQVLAIAALVLSAVTFGIGYRASRVTERRSRLPVLVFVFDREQGWSLHNVGNGPALNVVVAQKHVDGQRRGFWYGPVRVPPIARDAALVLPWLALESDYGLGAVYEDFLGADRPGRGRAYTVVCGNDRNVVTPGNAFPAWPETQIGRHWVGDAAT